MQRSDRRSVLWSPAGRIVPLIVIGLIWQAVSAAKLLDPSAGVIKALVEC